MLNEEETCPGNNSDGSIRLFIYVCPLDRCSIKSGECLQSSIKMTTHSIYVQFKCFQYLFIGLRTGFNEMIKLFLVLLLCCFGATAPEARTPGTTLETKSLFNSQLSKRIRILHINPASQLQMIAPGQRVPNTILGNLPWCQSIPVKISMLSHVPVCIRSRQETKTPKNMLHSGLPGKKYKNVKRVRP